MTNQNDKIRALLLAVLMVTSVFAGTIALAGTAYAANESINPSSEDVIEEGEDAAGNLTSLNVTFSADATDASNSPETKFAIDFSGVTNFDNGFLDTITTDDVIFQEFNGDITDNANLVENISVESVDVTEDNANLTITTSDDTTLVENNDYRILVLNETFQIPSKVAASDNTGAEFGPVGNKVTSVSSGSDRLTVTAHDDGAFEFESIIFYKDGGSGQALEFVTDREIDSNFVYNVFDRNGNKLTSTDQTLSAGTRNEKTSPGFTSDLLPGATVQIKDSSDPSTTDFDNTEFNITVGTTTIDDGGNDQTAFSGELIALDTVGNPTTNADIEIETGDFFRSRSAGLDSAVTTFNTSGLATGDYNITFENDPLGTTGNSQEVLTIRAFDFSVAADDTDVDLLESEGNVEIDATVNSSVANRDTEARLIDSGGDEVENKTVRIDGSGETDFSFVISEQDDYTIEVEDIATGVEDDTDVISVGEVEGSASFSQSVYSDQKGDVIEFTVNLANSDTATVNIGTEAGQDGIGYGSTFTVDDSDDEDGQVTVQFNTRDPSGEPTVSSDDDEITDFETAGADSTDDALDVEAYDVNVSVGSGEDDVATLNLNGVAANGFTLYTAPESSAIQDAENVSEITAFKEAGNFSEASTIAFGDYLYHELEVSGIGGMFANSTEDDDADKLDDILTQGSANKKGNVFELNLTIIESEDSVAANSDEKELLDTRDKADNQGTGDGDLDALEDDFVDFHVIADGKNDTYYIGFPMEFDDNTEIDGTPNPNSLDDEDEFDVTVNITDTGSNLVSENVSVTQTFTVENRSVELDTERDDAGDDLIRLEADSEQAVTGTTNLAPGSEIDIRVRATGENPFLLSQTVETDAQRNYETTFDLSDREVGLEFEVTATGPDQTSETVDAVIVESTATGTPAPTETATATPEPTATATATATATEEPTATETPGQPGFGVIVALLAFMAAALLAIRRD